jgi:hypothetical protein
MSEVTSPTPRKGARTFRVACGVLAAAATAQAVAWGVVSRPEVAVAVSKVAEPTVPAAPPVAPVPVDPFSSLAAPVEDPHPELSGPAGEEPVFDPAEAMLAAKAQPVMSVPQKPVIKAAVLDVPLKDEAIREHVDQGLYMRTEGDVKGALEHFRAALQKQPDHPRLIYYTASAMDLMGLQKKADPLWKQLFTLGDGAGDFYKMAQERMADGPSATGAEPEEEKEGQFTIVDLQEEKLPVTARGQKVKFVATLKKHTEDAVNVEQDMLLAIHFFDTVNGRRIARSQVPQPELKPVDLPVDWTDGTERFEFEYWQPDMSAEQFARFGRCVYYGCTLEVILKDKLQDATATTPELLQLARELPLPTPESQDNILNSTPDITVPPGRQPESSLFPPALTPPP